MSEEAASHLPATVLVERQIRALLALSPAYQRFPEDQQRRLSAGLLTIGAYLAEPEGFRANCLRGAVTAVPGGSGRQHTGDSLEPVNFPAFVAGLVQGVFHAIVEASIQQMEAYDDLVRSVAAAVDQFGAHPVTDCQARDWLATTYPEYFEREEHCRGLRFRQGADFSQAVNRLNLMLDEPLRTLDTDDIEKVLVPAARRRLAASRQQLLASMVLMGVNRNASPGASGVEPRQPA